MRAGYSGLHCGSLLLDGGRITWVVYQRKDRLYWLLFWNHKRRKESHVEADGIRFSDDALIPSLLGHSVRMFFEVKSKHQI
ncbi:hypothetical protein CEXT_209351 [Caerostris extrusa]|uniref:Uncharacterized protein n=1 Tax=Caerostris extrusa TaxID=172846 RepID=A0AAV4WSX2_CAEEX|nr:hypothetical protein CEXT_209351 [Caerostris extrusa]